MDKRISELNTALDLTVDDVLPIVNSGETKKVSVDTLKTYIAQDIGTDVVIKVTVKLATAINKGQAVYVSSATGTNIVVTKASNVSEPTSSKTIGLLETTGATNAIVNVITDGLLTGLNTSTAVIGDPVWLGTNGDLIYGLSNKPYAPLHLVYIGIVTRVSGTVGEILIKVQNGFELYELHNVSALTPSNDDFLQYESSTLLWKNKQLSTAFLNSKLNSLTNLSDSNYTILPTDKNVVTNTILTLPRVVTLPLANSVNAGYELIIADLIGTVTSINTLTISRANIDTINGSSTVVIGALFGMRRLISDGISKWTFDGGVMRISDYNFQNNKPITADVNGKLITTTTDLVNRRNGYTLSDDFVTLLSNNIWTRSTILSGTGAAQPLLLDENHIGVFSFGSSVTTNSGYYLINYGSATTANLSKLIPNLQTDLIFKLPVTINSLTTIRFGYTVGSITSADATNGAYFEIVGTSLVGKTASASVRSSTSATTLTADTWYHLRVTVVSTSLIKYDVYLMDGTLFSTQTLNTNIPTVALNNILIATCSDVVASQLINVDYIGITFPPMIRGALN